MSDLSGVSRVPCGLIICGSYGAGHDNRNGSGGQRLTLPSGERTWTVLGTDHRMVEPAEEYLEYLRAQQASPNTVKSYARALALWWQYLDAFDRRWDAVTLEEFGAFLTWLRTGDEAICGIPHMASYLEFRSLLAGRRWCQGWRLGPA